MICLLREIIQLLCLPNEGTQKTLFGKLSGKSEKENAVLEKVKTCFLKAPFCKRKIDFTKTILDSP